MNPRGWPRNNRETGMFNYFFIICICRGMEIYDDGQGLQSNPDLYWTVSHPNVEDIMN